MRTTASTGSDLFPATIGVANSGTRVAARFRDIPDTIRLFVSVFATAGTTTGTQARLVTTGPNGEGGTIGTGLGTSLFPIAATTNLSCGGTTPTDPTSGAALECCSDPGFLWYGNRRVGDRELESVSPRRVVLPRRCCLCRRPGDADSSNWSGSCSRNVCSVLCRGERCSQCSRPRKRGVSRFRASSSRPIWATHSASTHANQSAVPVRDDQSGFDTGIAISNTSADNPPFANPQNRRQNGNCTINYFGNVTGGGNAPNPQTTTPPSSGRRYSIVCPELRW